MSSFTTVKLPPKFNSGVSETACSRSDISAWTAGGLRIDMQFLAIFAYQRLRFGASNHISLLWLHPRTKTTCCLLDGITRLASFASTSFSSIKPCWWQQGDGWGATSQFPALCFPARCHQLHREHKFPREQDANLRVPEHWRLGLGTPTSNCGARAGDPENPTPPQTARHLDKCPCPAEQNQ